MKIENENYLIAGKTAHMLDKDTAREVQSHVSISALAVLEGKGVLRISFGPSGEEYVSLDELFRHYNIYPGE